MMRKGSFGRGKMVSVILVEDNEKNLLKLQNYINDYRDFEITGIFTNAKDAILSIEEKRPDIVFFGARSTYLNDTDLINYIKTVKKCSKLIFVIEEDFDYKFLELKELEHNPIYKSAYNFLLPSSSMVSNAKKCNRKSNKRQITCFGNLTIVNKENVTFVKWRTKKVKELFAYLICRYDKKISKDELISILFQGEDKTKALNHLYVTMSYLRKQLKDMGLSRKEFLIKNDYTLEIKDEICDFIDFDRFILKNSYIDDENIKEAEEVTKLYRGMFLEEEDYIWAYDIREFADKKYEELLLMISEYFREKNMLKKAEKALLKILAHNALSLNAYYQLLDLYIYCNRKEMFKKGYQKYDNVVRCEFNDLPEKKYVSFYNSLINE